MAKKKRAWRTLMELNELHKRGELVTPVEKFKTNEKPKDSNELQPTLMNNIRPYLQLSKKMSSSRFNPISRSFENPPDPDTYVPQLYGSFHATLSLLYEYLGNYKEAEKHHNISFRYNPFIGNNFIEILTSVCCADRWDHPHFATSLHPRQERLEHETDDSLYNEIESTDSLIAIVQKFYQPSDQFVVPSQLYTATLYRHLGRFSKADSILKSILKQTIETKGPILMIFLRSSSLCTRFTLTFTFN
jgi:tetratricopeptide (TPR) repeat protein